MMEHLLRGGNLINGSEPIMEIDEKGNVVPKKMNDQQNKVSCETCGGTGKVKRNPPCICAMEHLDTCPDCNGSGKRYLNMGDLREAYWLNPSGGNEWFDIWLRERYGSGVG